MKTLPTILILIVMASCVPSRTASARFFDQQATLVSVVVKDRTHATLTLVTPIHDTVKVLWGSTGAPRPRWIIGTKYTVRCDSSNYRLIDGRRYYLAKLNRNY
jgi:hypothetical protein